MFREERDQRANPGGEIYAKVIGLVMPEAG